MLVPNLTPFFYNTLDTMKVSITVMCHLMLWSEAYCIHNFPHHTA